MWIWGMISKLPDEDQLDIQMFESQREIVSFEAFLEGRKCALALKKHYNI